jgi:hypothetical protein
LSLSAKVSSTNKTDYYIINLVQIRLPKKFSALYLQCGEIQPLQGWRSEQKISTTLLTELLLKLVFDSKNAGVLANLNYKLNTRMDA